MTPEYGRVSKSMLDYLREEILRFKGLQQRKRSRNGVLPSTALAAWN
jgi:hypothetical protein